MKYKQIVFDIDGTLIFTKDAVLLSLRDTLGTLTGTVPETDTLTFSLGIPGRDALKKLQVPDLDAGMRLWDENMEIYRYTVRIFPGIMEVLDALSRSGCRTGVVTSESRAELAQDFGRLGLASWFSTIICASDTKEHKPSPAPLLKYMEMTGTSSDELLYIGDSIYDSQCARGAYVDFALAGWGCLDEPIDADYYLGSPRDLLPLLL